MENCLSCEESDQGRPRGGRTRGGRGGEGELGSVWLWSGPGKGVATPPVPVQLLATGMSSSAPRPLPKLMAPAKSCWGMEKRVLQNDLCPGRRGHRRGVVRGGCHYTQVNSLSAEFQEEPWRLPCPGVVTAGISNTQARLGFALQPGSEQLHLLLMLGWEGDISYLKAWPAAFKVCKRLLEASFLPLCPRECRTLTLSSPSCFSQSQVPS